MEDLLAWNDLGESWFGIPMKVTSKTHFNADLAILPGHKMIFNMFWLLTGGQAPVKPFTHINSILWKHLWERNCTRPLPHPILQRKKLRRRKARCPALGHRQWSGKAKKGHSRPALKPRFWPPHHAAFCNHCQCMSVWISLSRSTAKAITSSSLKITNVYMANE